MRQEVWSWCIMFIVISIARKEVRGDEVAFDAVDAIRSLREQVNALLDHRQQDYDKLESSLKRAIEKNTELFVLKDEVKQLRKEVIALRGGGNGNEAKNERLRVRWLGNAVTELQGEVAEVLRARNASEELAERSRMRGELALVKGDVGAVGRGIRNLGGRIAKIEAVLGTIRVDIAAVKERIGLLSRSCADIASQLSTVQIEVKSLRCESSDRTTSGVRRVDKLSEERKPNDGQLTEEEATNRVDRRADYDAQSLFAKRHRAHVVDRLKSLERKVSSAARRRLSLEKRVAYETDRWSRLNDRVEDLEKVQADLARQLSNASENATSTKMLGESLGSRLIEWLRTLEEAVETNESSAKREIARLDANAARKAAELSLTREELSNLRRTVQALSVSASKLQERSDEQREAIDRLNNSRSIVSEASSVSFHELNNLRRTVQALSVSASKLQERSDEQREAIDRLNNNRSIVSEAFNVSFDELNNLRRTVQVLSASVSRLQERSDEQPMLNNRSSVQEASNVSFDETEGVEDRYHLIGDDLPASCEEGTNEDGPRLLRTTIDEQPRSKPMLAFCRKGWIVVARRIDGSLDFDRSWNEYSVGFGSPVSEYWIGNEILHRLTRDNCSSLRVDLLDIYGERWRAEYERFAVDSKETGYKLRINGYRGNASDALSYQNGMPFSAKDLDMDASATHCARNYHGGWWFSRCQHANLNGKYSLGLTWFRSDSDRWMSVASMEMSIRRDPDCRAR